MVYARPEYIRTLRQSTPIADHVQVDFELRGCPIDKHQLLEVINAFLNRRRPNIPGHSVCVDCKRRGTVCVVVAHSQPCLGPVTHSGCGALCPSYDRGCFGCFGPKELANPASLADRARHNGATPLQLQRLHHGFNAWAEAFRAEGASQRSRRLTAASDE